MVTINEFHKACIPIKIFQIFCHCFMDLWTLQYLCITLSAFKLLTICFYTLHLTPCTGHIAYYEAIICYLLDNQFTDTVTTCNLQVITLILHCHCLTQSVYNKPFPYVFLFVGLDSRSSNPLHPEKHPQEPRRERLAMVEALHHSPAPH